MAKTSRGASTGNCVFCAIVQGTQKGNRVYEDEHVVAFLDHKPLLQGHCLVVPRQHIPTLADLPAALVAPLFGVVQLLSRAVEEGLEAGGSFTAINVKISQSVPHLHVHVVPRWKGDGLFSHRMIWKRSPYPDEAARVAVQEKVRAAVDRIRSST